MRAAGGPASTRPSWYLELAVHAFPIGASR
jgi:hypothetical protein